MDDPRVRPRAPRRRSHSTTRPFRTAMRAMAAGSLLLGIVALLHEDSPVARFMAARTRDEQNGRLEIRPEPGVSAQPQVVADTRPRNVPALDARTGKDSGRIWAASQSVPRGDRRAAIQLGPLEDTASTNAGKARAPFSDAADPGPFVTRTYRPISMSAVS